MTPFVLISVFLAPFAMVLPPFFDDARNSTFVRWLRAGVVGFAFALVWAVVDFNLRTPRPHLGHLLGIEGMLREHAGQILIEAVCICVASVPCFYCLDGVAIGLWSLIRRFPDEQPQQTASPSDEIFVA
jgi:hypothetical protein